MGSLWIEAIVGSTGSTDQQSNAVVRSLSAVAEGANADFLIRRGSVCRPTGSCQQEDNSIFVIRCLSSWHQRPTERIANNGQGSYSCIREFPGYRTDKEQTANGRRNRAIRRTHVKSTTKRYALLRSRYHMLLAPPQNTNNTRLSPV